MADKNHFSDILAMLVEGRNLPEDAIFAALDGILSGKWTMAQTAAFLTAMKIKGETPDELSAAARALRIKATPLPPISDKNAIDVCGTGGDGIGTFNISTAAAFVAAAPPVQPSPSTAIGRFPAPPAVLTYWQSLACRWIYHPPPSPNA